MEQFISIHEMRRRAPLHFWAKADNARFAAYAISTLDQEAQQRCAEQIGYGSGPTIAIREAFFREASISLELIIKAVIAQRIELDIAMDHVTRVKPTHDLVLLWEDAELPPLPPDDLHRLMIAKRALSWAGRYAAPMEDKHYNKERDAMEPLVDKRPFGRLHLILPRSFERNDFDRIYQVGYRSFCALRDRLLG
jgi:hypothetical protein